MLPYHQTAACARSHGHEHWEVSASDVRAGLQAERHRILRWLHIVRARRFGRRMVPDAPRLLDEAVALVQRKGALRFHVEVWTESEDERRQLADLLISRGFQTTESTLSYPYTVWMDLLPDSDESELLSTFHATCRRHIRAPFKRGYEVRDVTSPDLAGRMEALIRESFLRTGGQPPELDWSELIRQATEPESPVCIAGLFRGDRSGPLALVGFAVAFLHGEVAEYAHAGATREGESIPLLYAPTWHLMQWARPMGARYWDFGGIPKSAGSPLEGIKDFKLMYSRDIRRVGDEFVLHVRPTLSRLL